MGDVDTDIEVDWRGKEKSGRDKKKSVGDRRDRENRVEVDE